MVLVIMKNIMFEMGGKFFFIVFEDVDFDFVVMWFYIGIMSN